MPSMKTLILSEIKRTAANNGGVAIGWRSFAVETGISEADWKGRLWARWSDAVREAGLGPNGILRAYSVPELLEQYARLALHLGHLPVLSDMRLAVRNGLVFPEWRTFAKQFGSQRQLVKQLREYCRIRTEYGMVLALCDRYTPGSSGAGFPRVLPGNALSRPAQSA